MQRDEMQICRRYRDIYALISLLVEGALSVDCLDEIN